ncbi:MAG: alanine--tRNA ligase [Proteobacteria bacterium]|nr:MAG: alanine--tRNA ligase [Pseudomonadota bacterium]
MKSSIEIRQGFLNYFKENGHEIVSSSPLVPGNDPTLLFTNAGMVQFKDVFLGQDKRSYVRATTSQRCVRAGGKHNDLENVGYTARHHTFFEMLGNFSFGDYFKREAIRYSWEFLTQVAGLPAEKLWVTVYQDDDEAADIWLQEIGVDPSRFARIGDKPGGKPHESDNFWAMGDTGPCGPCSEIFYDHGPEIAGGPPGSPDEDGDRYIEIWNLVFMQYNRTADGTMHPLPKPSVDTGMGLERLAAVLQGVHSNYEIDLFQHLIAATADLAGVKDRNNSSLRVIADHIRACAFLITDGVLPSNEGRGYVLRRIIRRAIRHGHNLGLKEPFFHKLVGPLCEEMGQAYPELIKAREQVEKVLRLEAERFAETLDQGMRILEESIAGMKGTEIPGDTVFLLYDTYGFPVDLTNDIARERKLTLDIEGFERNMSAQRERARAASQFGVDYGAMPEMSVASVFNGYDRLSAEGKVVALFRGNEAVEQLTAGEEGMIVLDSTPFYAESGGQVGDRGELTANGAVFEVADTLKQGGAHVHVGRLTQGTVKRGQQLSATVDGQARQATALNHSATHLLHAALRQVLGSHVTQKGSLVSPDRLRFDFSHFEPVTMQQLQEIEQLVNDQVRVNTDVDTQVMSYDDAVGAGAMALFGEKYGDRVRVLRIGDFSTELCGGTHVKRAGDIGIIKIVSEAGIAAGVRRIEAVTGAAALRWIEAADTKLQKVAELVKGGREDIEERVRQLLDRNRTMEKEIERLKDKLASSQGGDLATQAIDMQGVKVLAARMDGADARALRSTVDQLKSQLGSAAVLLAGVEDGKVNLVAGVTNDSTGRIKAGEFLNQVATKIGGRGGGRPDMAQGGGSDPSALDGALAAALDWAREQLS